MSSVDSRIVEMEFKNQLFERRVDATIKALDKLTKSLEFKGAKDGFSEVSKSANKLNFSGLQNSVSGISKGFIAMSTVAITAISRITNAALSAGVNIARALAIEPVTQGFGEYEQNINSIQTILANTASKGSTLEDVNAALLELNEYADLTIYNFSEMARNIGTFTAAGVDLDTSVGAIKGIANLGGISGAQPQQVATAMYQLSQALATGTVRLQDWNSVANASLGGEVFKTLLFETGKALGALDDVPIDMTFEQWEDAGNKFRETLQEEWLTAEVLTTALNALTGDLNDAELAQLGYADSQLQYLRDLGELGKESTTTVKTLTQLFGVLQEAVGSGWAQSFQLLFGDFEEAKAIFTGASNYLTGIIGESADARNEVLRGWEALGGRERVINGLKNSFQAASRVIAPIRRAFRDFFPKTTALDLFKLSVGFERLTRKLIPTDEQMRFIRHTMRGVFAIGDILRTVIVEMADTFGELYDEFVGISGTDVLGFFADLGDRIVEIRDYLVDEGGIAKFFDDFVSFAKDPIPYLERLRDQAITTFGQVRDAIKGVLSGEDEFSFTLPFTDEEVDVSGYLENVRDKIEEVRAKVQETKEEFGKWREKLDPVVQLFSRIKEEVVGFAKEVPSKLKQMWDEKDFEPLQKAIGVGLLGGVTALLVKFFKGGFDLKGSFVEKVAQLFGTLTGTLEDFQQNIKANAILKIGIAVGILVGSVVLLSTIPAEDIAKSLGALSVGFGQLFGSLLLLGQIGAGIKGGLGIGAVAVALIAVSTGILVMAFALKAMQGLDWEDVGIGLTTISGLLVSLAGTAKLLSYSSSNLIVAGVGMIALAGGLYLMSFAMEKFADMPWEVIGKGLAGVAGTLAAVGVAMQLVPKGMITKSVGILVLAGALHILASAMSKFAAMSWEEIGKGLTAVAGALIAIGFAAQIMPVTLAVKAAGLYVVALALAEINKVMQSFGGMSWEEIGKGMTVLAGSLLILSVALNSMTFAIFGATALVVAAAGLDMLVDVLKKAAGLDWLEVAKGLLVLGVALFGMAGAAAALAPLIPVMLGVGAALLLLGAGFALIGVGVAALAWAFQVIADAGGGAIFVIGALIDAVLRWIPDILKFLGQALVDIAKILLEAVPGLLEGLKEILLTVIDVFIEVLPELFEALDVATTELLGYLKERFPDFVEVGFEMLMSLLRGIEENIEEIVDIATNVIVAFLQGLEEDVDDIVAAALGIVAAFVEGVASKASDVVAAGIELIVQIINGITEKIGDFVTAVYDLVTEFITELGANSGRLITAGGEVVADVIEGLGNAAGKIVTAGKDAIISFIEGFGEAAAELAAGALRVILDFLIDLERAIDLYWPRIIDQGGKVAEALVEGTVEGLGRIGGRIKDKLVEIVGDAWDAILGFFGISSPSKEMAWVGEMLILGMVKGLKDHGDKVPQASADVADKTVSTFVEAIKKASKDASATLEKDLRPVITPVVDLSEAQETLSGRWWNDRWIPDTGALAQRSAAIASTIHKDTELLAGETAKDGIAKPWNPFAGEEDPGRAGLTFIQNNHSPKALTTKDLYRQTKTQVKMAKKELAIP